MRPTVLRSALPLALGLAATAPLVGQTLVEDINTAPPAETASSSPSGFAEAGGRAYFAATDVFGSELWATDGSEAGTVLVKDISPGPTSSSPNGFTALPSGVVVFEAGGEPWRSDGTAAGTFSLGDLRPGPATSNPSEFTAFGGAVYFFANDGTHGVELWRTDGTVAGTQLVIDLLPGAAGVAGGELCASGGFLYFGAPIPSSGHVLVRSDGTGGGTAAVKLITHGAFQPLEELTDAGGVLLFRAVDPALGSELWRSDGTAAGTSVLKDIAPGGAGSAPTGLFRVGDVVYFSAVNPAIGRELWVTDGNASGTFPVADVFPGAVFGSEPLPVGALGTRYLFSALTWNEGRELWSTDGTTAGTKLVANISPSSGSSNPSRGITLGGKLYFLANDGAHGVAVWVTDGTAAGTTLVKDVSPGATITAVGPLAAFGDRLLFSGEDEVHGAEPWISDGTTAGTTLLADLAVGALTASSDPEQLTRVGDRLFFTAADEVEGRELWISDGTAAGTERVISFRPGPESTTFGSFEPFGERLFFFASGPFGFEPHVTDGTPEGTALLLDVFTGPGDSVWGETPRAVFGGRLLFGALDPTFFGSLFVTDGTPEGTHTVAPLSPVDMKVVGGRLLLIAGSPATGIELFVTDDPTVPPTLLTEILPGVQSGIFNAFRAATDTRAWFQATDPVLGFELFTTDGTAAGTRVVADLTKGGVTTTLYDVEPFGDDEALLHVHDSTNGHRLLVTDAASPEGVTVLATLGPNDPISGLHRAGDLAFFATGNTSGEWDFWRTDGTTAGTWRLNGDLEPIYPAVFAAPGSGGKMAFGAWNAEFGRELFVSDGSAAAPTLVADIAPGPLDASPHDLVRVGGTVFFVADDADHGDELHALPLAAFGDHAAEPFGAGFAPAGETAPTLAAVQPPVAGQTLALGVTDLPPSSPVLLLVGAAPTDLLLPGGERLHVAGPFVGLPGTSDATGQLTFSSPVPAGLVGTRAVVQALSTVGGGILVGSPGLEVVVGP